MDGLTATERLRAREGAPEVLVLTTFDTDGEPVLSPSVTRQLIQHVAVPASCSTGSATGNAR